VYQAHLALVESEFSAFAASVTPENLNDFELAKIAHIYQGRHFADTLDMRKFFRDRFQWALENTYKQLIIFNQHTVRSLTLANGAVVLATLAYIGNVARGGIPRGLIWVIGLCAFGFLLTLFGSHLVVVLSMKLVSTLNMLMSPRMPDKDIFSGNDVLQKRARLMLYCTQPFFYLSAICLVAALIIGVKTLVVEQANVASVQSVEGPFEDILVE
jgi:hypothetical protein